MGRWVWLGESICDSPHPSDLCYLPDLALPLSSCNIHPPQSCPPSGLNVLLCSVGPRHCPALP